jgi:hypothetical protein
VLCIFVIDFLYSLFSLCLALVCQVNTTQPSTYLLFASEPFPCFVLKA